MSFGFDEEPYVDGKPVISNAIHDALRNRDGQILFFAAAANDGGNRREMFPARHEQVFSIRATDHEGDFQKFNPPPDFKAAPVFGTLGKDVPGAQMSKQNGEVCKTGTSVATPIAVGTAATILGYVRLGLESKRFKDDVLMRKVWKKNGMYQAFLGLSRGMQEKLFYLHPQTFFRELGEQARDALLLDAARKA